MSDRFGDSARLVLSGFSPLFASQRVLYRQPGCDVAGGSSVSGFAVREPATPATTPPANTPQNQNLRPQPAPQAQAHTDRTTNSP